MTASWVQVQATDLGATEEALVMFRYKVRRALRDQQGYECQEADGDFMLAFTSPDDAVRFCLSVRFCCPFAVALCCLSVPVRWPGETALLCPFGLSLLAFCLCLALPISTCLLRWCHGLASPLRYVSVGLLPWPYFAPQLPDFWPGAMALLCLLVLPGLVPWPHFALRHCSIGLVPQPYFAFWRFPLGHGPALPFWYISAALLSSPFGMPLLAAAPNWLGSAGWPVLAGLSPQLIFAFRCDSSCLPPSLEFALLQVAVCLSPPNMDFA